MTALRVRFPGAAAELSARLHLPPGGPRAVAVFAHCFTCSKDLRAAVRIAEALEARSIAVLRFDFTGLGGSGGELAGLSSNARDLVAAARWLEAEHAAPSILIGHSLGGTAALVAAADIESVRAVATIGAPADTAGIERIIEAAAPDLEERGEATVDIGGRPFRVRPELLEDLRAHDLPGSIATLRRALLFCHSPRDRIVGIDDARRLFEAARHPKSFVSLDDADHLLSRGADAAYAAEVIAAWSARYVEAESVDQEPIADVVVTTGRGGYATDVAAGAHRIRSDEPRSVGGTGTGPDPYALLLGALGSCTGITVRMYADRKKWPLEDIEVRLHHERVHASDCADCATREGKIDRIDREIALSGDLDASQRERLLEIADRCPVHRTLISEIWIRSRLADEGTD